VGTLVVLLATPLTKPRPPSATSIPAILKALQDEWVEYQLSLLVWNVKNANLRKEKHLFTIVIFFSSGCCYVA